MSGSVQGSFNALIRTAIPARPCYLTVAARNFGALGLIANEMIDAPWWDWLDSRRRESQGSRKGPRGTDFSISFFFFLLKTGTVEVPVFFVRSAEARTDVVVKKKTLPRSVFFFGSHEMLRGEVRRSFAKVAEKGANLAPWS